MNSMQTLADLIKSVQDKNGWSDRDLGRRAEKLEIDITTSNFSRLKNRELVSVKGSLIRKLALVLMVPEQKVAQAALASMGLNLEIPEVTVEDAVRNSPDFSIRDQTLIMGLVNAMRDTGSGSDEQQSNSAAPDDTSPRLRAVAPASDPGPGQKTGPSTGNDAELELDQIGIPQLHGDDTYKAPLDSAAHPRFETSREKFERLHGGRGEENQDPGEGI